MEPLSVNLRLFAALDEAGVRYCHWKSNLHLDLGVAGVADLDLLVSSEHRGAFDRIAHDLGFIDLVAPRLRALPDIEDLLGFDEATGRLSHLHVHHRLVLGEKRVKHHRLPIEDWLLEDTRPIDDVPVPAPEKELFVLYIRAILKSDPRSALRTMRGVRRYAVPEEIVEEARWLLAQTDDLRLDRVPSSAGLDMLTEGFEEFIARIHGDDLTPGYVVREKRRLLHKLRRYQRYPTTVGAARKTWFRARYSRPGRRIARVSRKHLDHPGPFVAVVGVDGSGKTTLVNDLTEWLGWKVETRRIFFGQPKRSVPLRAIRKARYGTAYVGRRWGTALRADVVIERVVESLRAAEWLYVAAGRVGRESVARRASAAGEVVIAERYPLPEIADSMKVAMDGPRLRGFSAAPAWAVAQEERLYDRIGAADPVFLLETESDTLHARRLHENWARLDAKAIAVRTAVASGRYQAVAADQPYEDVLIDLKRRIWSLL
jgi:thymidylate kinase